MVFNRGRYQIDAGWLREVPSIDDLEQVRDARLLFRLLHNKPQFAFFLGDFVILAGQ